MKTVYESKSGYFSLSGNGRFRTGWTPTRLGEKKRALIIKALKQKETFAVYRRNGKGYCMTVNGVEERIF